MPFPNIDPLIETFLEPTRIYLFGKPFPSLKYDPTAMSAAVGAGVPAAPSTTESKSASPESAPELEPEFEPYTVPVPGESGRSGAPADLPMPPGRVEQALRQVEDEGQFARIYGFSFEGHYYKMPRPVLLLVRDEGRSRSPENAAGSGGTRDFDTRFTGVEAKDWQFGSDLEIGTYNEVLLQSLTSGRDESGFRGRLSSRNAAEFRGRLLDPHQDR